MCPTRSFLLKGSRGDKSRSLKKLSRWDTFHVCMLNLYLRKICLVFVFSHGHLLLPALGLCYIVIEIWPNIKKKIHNSVPIPFCFSLYFHSVVFLSWYTDTEQNQPYFNVCIFLITWTENISIPPVNIFIPSFPSAVTLYSVHSPACASSCWLLNLNL